RIWNQAGSLVASCPESHELPPRQPLHNVVDRRRRDVDARPVLLKREVVQVKRTRGGTKIGVDEKTKRIGSREIGSPRHGPTRTQIERSGNLGPSAARRNCVAADGPLRVVIAIVFHLQRKCQRSSRIVSHIAFERLVLSKVAILSVVDEASQRARKSLKKLEATGRYGPKVRLVSARPRMNDRRLFRKTRGISDVECSTPKIQRVVPLAI